MDGNRRIQDGYKIPLLCNDCEGIISKFENSFSLKIFQVFTNQYLDLSGRIIKDGYLQYGNWLNKFIISVVWRSFKSDLYTDYPKGFSNNMVDRVDSLLECWRKYLLGESNYCGNITNYLLFLRNIHDGTGELPEDISPKIIHYLMRTIDGSLIFDDNSSLVMTKLGPIMLFTAIYPNKIDGYPDSIIRKSGKIKIEQNWSNAELNRYIFVDRPNEWDKMRIKTIGQQEQVDKAIEKNKKRMNETMTIPVVKSDMENKT